MMERKLRKTQQQVVQHLEDLPQVVQQLEDQLLVDLQAVVQEDFRLLEAELLPLLEPEVLILLQQLLMETLKLPEVLVTSKPILMITTFQCHLTLKAPSQELS